MDGRKGFAVMIVSIQLRRRIEQDCQGRYPRDSLSREPNGIVVEQILATVAGRAHERTPA